MLLLIKNGEVFQPEHLGRKDILVAGGSIIAIEDSIDSSTLPVETTVIDAAGLPVTPGFIDGHQHFTGGGGEGGFTTRAPEMQLSMNTTCGVTTAVGLLGTDGITRTVEALYAKTQAFNEEGITAFMLTGSYWLPSPTITENVSRDIAYIAPVIGVKLALSDIRGPHLDTDAVTTLASDVRTSALIAGKPGIVTLHMGVRPQRLKLILKAVEKYGIRADTFVVTHINRKDKKLLEQAFTLGEQGSLLDATGRIDEPAEDAVSTTAADFAMTAMEKGLFEQVTFSSDAGGSMPQWDADRKNIIGMTIATPESLPIELNRLVKEKGLSLDKALLPLTKTPAAFYGLKGRKGELNVGADADILVLDPETMKPRDVVAKGQVMVRDTAPVKTGFFETK